MTVPSAPDPPDPDPIQVRVDGGLDEPRPDEVTALPAATIAALAPPPPASCWADIVRRRAAEDRAVVVLDDDPTGTQTVHGVAVLTTWDVDALAAELARADCLFVLTNSRSLPEPSARALAAGLGANLRRAAERAGRSVAVISRSDSTLRGHVPAEIDALLAAWQEPVDGIVLAPWFLDGGRVTIGGVHYARLGDELVPVGRSEFAADASFGYRRSYLPAWIEEKTGGAVPASTVGLATIEQIRSGGPDRLAAWLLARPPGGWSCFDAADERDVEVVVDALLQAEAAGRRYLYRTAASFVRVRAAIEPHPLLRLDEVLDADGRGRLLVVGSHVPRSTEQLARVLARPDVIAVELDVAAVQGEAAAAEVARCADAVQRALAEDRDVVLHTSRELHTGVDAAESLAISGRVSAALVACVAALRQQPRLLVAKGGITSSDIATEALGVRRAMVLGQLQAGVPVWELGEETRFPGLRYVVFPGNVGGPDALVELLGLDAGEG